MIAAIEPTSLIVVAVFILTFLGVAYGLKTRKGSGINEHPGPASENPVQPPEDSTPGQLPDADSGDSTVLDQHGTK